MYIYTLFFFFNGPFLRGDVLATRPRTGCSLHRVYGLSSLVWVMYMGAYRGLLWRLSREIQGV